MSDTYQPRHREDASGNATLVAGVVVFLSTIGAYVYMETHGYGTAQLLALAGPVIAALLITKHVTTLTRKQNEQIETVVQQTNGQLDARIREQVRAAITDAGLAAPPGPAGEPPSTSTMPNGFHRDRARFQDR